MATIMVLSYCDVMKTILHHGRHFINLRCKKNNLKLSIRYINWRNNQQVYLSRKECKKNIFDYDFYFNLISNN